MYYCQNLAPVMPLQLEAFHKPRDNRSSRDVRVIRRTAGCTEEKVTNVPRELKRLASICHCSKFGFSTRVVSTVCLNHALHELNLPCLPPDQSESLTMSEFVCRTRAEVNSSLHVSFFTVLLHSAILLPFGKDMSSTSLPIIDVFDPYNLDS